MPPTQGFVGAFQAALYQHTCLKMGCGASQVAPPPDGNLKDGKDIVNEHATADEGYSGASTSAPLWKGGPQDEEHSSRQSTVSDLPSFNKKRNKKVSSPAQISSEGTMMLTAVPGLQVNTTPFSDMQASDTYVSPVVPEMRRGSLSLPIEVRRRTSEELDGGEDFAEVPSVPGAMARAKVRLSRGNSIAEESEAMENSALALDALAEEADENEETTEQIEEGAPADGQAVKDEVGATAPAPAEDAAE